MRTLKELTPTLSARSVLLSLLLGMETGSLPVSAIINVIEPLGFTAPTLRTALSRMVVNGDLKNFDGVYTLESKHQVRKRTQEEKVNPKFMVEETGWSMAVITATGRSASSRTITREILYEYRYAELCNGVWLRPDNLIKKLPLLNEIQVFTVKHDDEQYIVNCLWDLEVWAAEANLIIDALNYENEPNTRFLAAAAAVRHLKTDPVLPIRLQPNNWPAKDLLKAYKIYRHYITCLASERIEKYE